MHHETAHRGHGGEGGGTSRGQVGGEGMREGRGEWKGERRGRVKTREGGREGQPSVHMERARYDNKGKPPQDTVPMPNIFQLQMPKRVQVFG